jgi:hypothetical protein
VQVRDLEALPRALGRLGRDHGLFASGEAVTEHVGGDAAWAHASDERGGERRGIRVRRDRTVSVWAPLPSDGLGQIFDSEDIARRLRSALLVATEAAPATSPRVAPAVGVAPVGMLVEGSIVDPWKKEHSHSRVPSRGRGVVRPRGLDRSCNVAGSSWRSRGGADCPA